MKILITGGSGFIGSALIRFLINSKKKHKIINVDLLVRGSVNESLKFIKNSDRYMFKKIDICNQKKIYDLIFKHKPDIIFNLAAESHVDNSILDPQKTFYTNVLGTLNLAEICRNLLNRNVLKRNTFKFIQISTDEVFGSLKRYEKSFNERSNYKPNSPYSSSKASSDHIINAWIKTYSFPGIITHCTNNFGPWQFPEKLIPVVIYNCLIKKNIPVYGKGENIRQWIYVEDHIRALNLILEKGKIFETYNIGSGNSYTNIYLIKNICNILNKLIPSEINYLSLIKFVKDRPGHDFKYSINSNKISKQLNYNPIYNFKNALFNTVKWYIDNFEWLEKKVQEIEKN